MRSMVEGSRREKHPSVSRLRRLLPPHLTDAKWGGSSVANSGRRRHMPARESVGRLRPPTWSGPEGSSHNGLRRVGRLLHFPQLIA